jgi:hypothetical protein
VVGNWTAEAARFTPDLRVSVHHGANRAAPDEIAAQVDGADLVVTTYGTAVRDVEALAGISWARVILDEAQVIKNPANDTSQQLRRIPARSGSRSRAPRERPRRPLGHPRLRQPRARRQPTAVHRASLE